MKTQINIQCHLPWLCVKHQIFKQPAKSDLDPSEHETITDSEMINYVYLAFFKMK